MELFDSVLSVTVATGSQTLFYLDADLVLGRDTGEKSLDSCSMFRGGRETVGKNCTGADDRMLG